MADNPPLDSSQVQNQTSQTSPASAVPALPAPPAPTPGTTPGSPPPTTAAATGSTPPAIPASTASPTTSLSSPPPPDWRKPSFDFAADSTKQLITVATGVITATVIFAKDLDSTSRALALACWIVLTLSIFCGLFVLFNMSGELHNAATTSRSPDLYNPGIRTFSIAQLGVFLVGVILVMIFGVYAKPEQKNSNPQPLTINCVAPPAPQQQIAPTKEVPPNPIPKLSSPGLRHFKK